MDQFEAARLKHLKRQERKERQPKVEEIPVAKAAPKKDEPMSILVYGPCDLAFEVEYAGTLLASQLTREALIERFKRQLAEFGRVRCL